MKWHGWMGRWMDGWVDANLSRLYFLRFKLSSKVLLSDRSVVWFWRIWCKFFFYFRLDHVKKLSLESFPSATDHPNLRALRRDVRRLDSGLAALNSIICGQNTLTRHISVYTNGRRICGTSYLPCGPVYAALYWEFRLPACCPRPSVQLGARGK